ncbi:MAG: ribosomal RNA small subunit methyltransferase A [Patescibacteria group bacterium]|nr:ribosomal RNA small subunit methyltransferase A [Patescibacteria group bacterium]
MKRTSYKRRGAKLGQHLLTNPAVARAVVEAAEVTAGDAVLEIGPGKGMLTRELLAAGARVTAIEKDPAMVTALKELFAKDIAEGRLKLIENDARAVTPDTVFPKGSYKIAANIPYYITGELIREALTAKNQPRALAFLVQKEVAERIARSKKESILSLSVKVYGTPRYVRTVSKGNFAPAPNVDSAILAVTHISRTNFKKVSEKDFFVVVKAGFAQKRKTLAGNLKKVFGEHALDMLTAGGIPEKTRAEDVPLKEWIAVCSSR